MADDIIDNRARNRYELTIDGVTYPAVVDGRVYVRGATHLFCFGKK